MSAAEDVLYEALADVVVWANTVPKGWRPSDPPEWHHKSMISEVCSTCQQQWPCPVQRGVEALELLDDLRSSRGVPSCA